MALEIQKYAVIGDPVKHSLSPLMQSAALESMGIAGDYSAIHVNSSNLEKFIHYARAELNGFNITVPHKSAVIPFIDALSDGVRLTGSVNTVTVKNGILYGESTDGYGLATAIKESFGIDTTGHKFFFIGCGGAVRAVSFFLADMGAEALCFVNRTVEKAECLATELAKCFPDVHTAFASLSDEGAISEFAESSDVVIQGTSLGLDESDMLPLVPDILGENICFYDTIYRATPLLKALAAKGIKTADGRSMLLHQGAKALSIWTGREAPVEAMRKALYAALDKRGQ